MTNAETLQLEARRELGGALVPMPDDLLSDVGPTAAVWYLQEVAAYVLAAWAGMLSSDASGDLADDDPPIVALNGITEIVGMANAVCVILGLMEG